VSRPRRLWTRGIISVILWITFLLLISSVVQRLLTPNDAFTTTALFDLTVPQTVGGFFQAELVGNADIVSVQVENCAPGLPPVICGSATAPVIFLRDANFAANTFPIIAQTPLDTSNQQILLELSHPTAGMPDVFGSFAYVNGGVSGALTTLGDYTGLFKTTDSAQAGFLNLSLVFSVPEPSSLTLLASSIPSVLGLAWLRRRKAAVSGSKVETRT
jgi:PEP-CTERM motif-containing protein